MTGESEKARALRTVVLQVGACSLTYGVLMGWRAQLTEHWAKNVVAACAGLVLGGAIALVTSYRSRKK